MGSLETASHELMGCFFGVRRWNLTISDLIPQDSRGMSRFFDRLQLHPMFVVAPTRSCPLDAPVAIPGRSSRSGDSTFRMRSSEAWAIFSAHGFDICRPTMRRQLACPRNRRYGSGDEQLLQPNCSTMSISLNLESPMAMLIAQLADIHIKTSDDGILRRAQAIGSAICAEATPDVSRIVLAFCGDIAYSGARAQFKAAVRFIEQIEYEIRKRLPAVAQTKLFVPGNHDCNFAGDQAARDVLLKSLDGCNPPAQSIQELILEPLREFFAFSREQVDKGDGITNHSPYYICKDIPDHGSTVRFHLVNTAWMSSIEERPGSLVFPTRELVPQSEPADLGIAILHHPLNWFKQPESFRPLRDAISQLASVVLVNHEHTSEAVRSDNLFPQNQWDESTLYISGGVLQEEGSPRLCSFNLLRIAPNLASINISRFEFRGSSHSSYFERTATADQLLTVAPMGLSRDAYGLSEEMCDFLDDPGSPVHHPDRGQHDPIRLSELFLYPDLWDFDSNAHAAEHKQIRSPNVPNEILSTPRVLISGGERSGRTSLLKRLFSDAHRRGRVPLFLSACELPKNLSKLRTVVRTRVKLQYARLTPDAFEQVEREDRVLLLDDLHMLPRAKNTRELLLTHLEHSFGTVVLSCSDAMSFEELSHGDGASALTAYRNVVILGFGEYLRDQFVRQWLRLSHDTVDDDDNFEWQVGELCQLLNTVIRKHLIPPYPLFLTAVLQTPEVAHFPVQGGSFGHLFGGVITAILERSHFQRLSIGDKYHYLAALARSMFDSTSMSMGLEALEEWHYSYWEKIDVRIDFRNTLNDFVRLGILSCSTAHVRFKYPYFFCFFIAYQLNHTIHETRSRDVIATLCRRLDHKVSADIILFLAHLTGDPLVLNEMTSTCDSLFQNTPPATLDGDVQQLNQLGFRTGTITIADEPDENRQQLKLQSDEDQVDGLISTQSDHDVNPPKAIDEAAQYFFEILASLKTVQILGQALRNSAGSLNRERKEEIITKILGLSRRVIGEMLGCVDDDELALYMQEIELVHREHGASPSKQAIRSEACGRLLDLSRFCCSLLVTHTTRSIGSQNLQPTIRRLLGDDVAVVDRVFRLSFDLASPGKFPREDAVKLHRQLEKNEFTASVVRTLVATHMYTYFVPYNIRQSVCALMDIELEPAALDQGSKMLGRQAKK